MNVVIDMIVLLNGLSKEALTTLFCQKIFHSLQEISYKSLQGDTCTGNTKSCLVHCCGHDNHYCHNIDRLGMPTCETLGIH